MRAFVPLLLALVLLPAASAAHPGPCTHEYLESPRVATVLRCLDTVDLQDLVERPHLPCDPTHCDPAWPDHLP